MLATAITRWIPKDATAIEHPAGLAIAYSYTDPKGRTAAIAYHGKANKPDFHECYFKAESRDKRIADYFAGVTAHELQKAQWREERNRPHTLKPGDILHHSWGWEQTNCDYYQILSVTPHGATIRAIASETVDGSTVSHGMADMRVPVRDAFHGEPIKVRINGRNQIAASEGRFSYGCANLWDGKPNYCSWYA